MSIYAHIPIYNTFGEIVLLREPKHNVVVQMIGDQKKRHTGECLDCGGPLELVELDIKKGRRVLQCQRCGLLHFYKKAIFGGWKFFRATKNLSK